MSSLQNGLLCNSTLSLGPQGLRAFSTNYFSVTQEWKPIFLRAYLSNYFVIDLKSLLSKKRFGKALLSLPLVHRPWWHILYDVCSVAHHVFLRGFATARPQGHKDQIDLSLFASLPLHIFCMFYSTKNLRRIFWESRFQTQVESKQVFVSMFTSVSLPTESLCLKTSVDVAQKASWRILANDRNST